jgi:hypothetical protein
VGVGWYLLKIKITPKKFDVSVCVSNKKKGGSKRASKKIKNKNKIKQGQLTSSHIRAAETAQSQRSGAVSDPERAPSLWPSEP